MFNAYVYLSLYVSEVFSVCILCAWMCNILENNLFN